MSNDSGELPVTQVDSYLHQEETPMVRRGGWGGLGAPVGVGWGGAEERMGGSRGDTHGGGWGVSRELGIFSL